jgi:hypothetical protein
MQSMSMTTEILSLNTALGDVYLFVCSILLHIGWRQINFSVFSNKADIHDLTEIVLKVTMKYQ